MEKNEHSRPHTAVICCQLEIHSLLNTGECSGKIVDDKTLNKHGLKPTFLLGVSGFDRDDCIKNLKSKLKLFAKEE